MAAPSKRDLGARIRAARRARLGQSQVEFGQTLAWVQGRAAPYSSVTVSNWEIGRQEPSWPGLVAIAQLTSLPLEYFAGLGALEDYPAVQELSREADRPLPELESLMLAFQRLDAGQQRIMMRQLEALLDALGEQERAEGASA